MGKDLKGNPLPPGIMQRKSGIYRGRFYYKGETYTKDNADLKKLVQEMEDLRYEVKHGLKGKGDNITLDTWFDIWLNTHKKRTIKESTQVRYDDFYRRYIKKQIGKQRVADFNPIILERLLQNMADDDYSTKTIRDVYNILNAMFKYAVHNRILTFNPCAGVEVPKTKTKQIRVLTVKEQREVLEHAKERIHENLIQVALGTGMRGGEVCGLTWQDINLEEQCLTIKRSIRYDGTKHKNIIGPTKRKKVRIVDFGDTLTEILKTARKKQLKSRMQYGELYHRNFYKEAQDKNRVYYEYYHLDGTEEIPVDYKEISFVCLRPDGCLELPSTLSIACRSVAKRLDGFENFHFHQLRHTYTSNLLSNGAAPKDVQELLGHSDVSTTMNVYAHSTRKAKRNSARLLDKVAGND